MPKIIRRRKTRVWYAGSVLAFIVVFQLFLRYDYIHVRTKRVVRVDRLTGSTCYMPCKAPQ